MPQNVKWKYDFKRLGLIRAQAKRTLESRTKGAAEKARQSAASAAPSHTGALGASLYVLTSSSNPYSSAIIAARTRNPALSGSAELGPLNLPPNTRDFIQAALDCPLDYGAVIENGALGPTGAYIGARPFFIPAVEGVRDEFLEDLARALQTL